MGVTAPPPPPACQPSVQSFSAGSSISQQGIILPNVCQTSVQAKSIINKPSMILPSISQFIFNNNNIGGVTAPPPIYLLTLTNQLSGPPRHPHQQGSNRRRPKALRTRSPQHPHHEGSNRRRPKTLSTISPAMEGPKP